MSAAEISARITEETPSNFVIAVTVAEAGSSTRHEVTVSREDFDRLREHTDTPDIFVSRCFEFLLARESKESILSTFDISVISQYFPDFESEISK